MKHRPPASFSLAIIRTGLSNHSPLSQRSRLSVALGFCLGLAFGVEPLIRDLAERPRRRSGPLVSFALFRRDRRLGRAGALIRFGLTRHCQRNHWIQAERDGLLLAGEAARQPPELGTLRRYEEVEAPPSLFLRGVCWGLRLLIVLSVSAMVAPIAC